MASEDVQRALVDATDVAAVAVVELLDERLREIAEILQPVAQRR